LTSAGRAEKGRCGAWAWRASDLRDAIAIFDEGAHLKFWAGLGILGLVGVIVWKLAFPTYTHRYRLTIEIEADGKVHQGSGVIEVGYNSHGPLEHFVQGKYDTTTKGRAPIADLGSRGIILASLLPFRGADGTGHKPVHPNKLALGAFYGERRVKNPNGKVGELRAWQAIAYESGRKVLPLELAPEFIWLSDPTQRSTAVLITASEIPSIVGSSVKLRSISVEITTDPVSDEIYSKLPWLKAAKENEEKNGTILSTKNFVLQAAQLLGEL
jgi:hypothetical protein